MLCHVHGHVLLPLSLTRPYLQSNLKNGVLIDFEGYLIMAFQLHWLYNVKNNTSVY
jgi:hypothetical protein